MNILVTGASGFIGERLIKALGENKKNNIYAVSRSADGKGHILQCDVLDYPALEEIFSRHKFDAVVHLAAITAHDDIVNHSTETLDINLQGTVNLLKCFNLFCRNAQFIYASTGKVYGKTNQMPITENAYTNPTTILGKSKRITEQIVDFYAEHKNRYLICRIFNIYGGNQKRNFVFPTIVDQLNTGVVQLGNIDDLRDYLYVDDLINALISCILHPGVFETVDYVNIGSGEPHSVREMVELIRRISGIEFELRITDSRKRYDETPVEYCDNAKLRKLTDWHPQFSFEEGIRNSLMIEDVI